MLNKFQKVALTACFEGAYAHMTEALDEERTPYSLRKAVSAAGDDILTCMVMELNGVVTTDDAIARLFIAKTEIDNLLQVLGHARANGGLDAKGS